MNASNSEPRFHHWLQERAPRSAPPAVLARAMGEIAADAHREQRWGWATLRMTALAPALVVVLVAAIATAAIVGNPFANPVPIGPSTSGEPSSSGGPTASPSPSVTPAPTVWPTLPTEAADVPAELDLAHVGFWTLESPMAYTPPYAHTLRIGTLDGRVTRTVSLADPGMGPLDVPLLPSPAGPAGGRVAYVADDGGMAALHIVDVGSGTDHELFETNSMIARLAISPDGSSVYFFTMDRKTGEPLEVQAVYVETGDFQSIIGYGEIHPVAAAGNVLAAQSAYLPQLAVSQDGGWVVLASCSRSACDLLAARPGAGLVRRWSNFSVGEGGDDQIWGIAGNLLIGTSSCADGDCGPFALDLETGSRNSLDLDPMTMVLQVIRGPHGPLVLAGRDDQESGTWRVDALDLTDRSIHPVFSATFEPMQSVVGLAERYGAGAELSPGWFLVYRNADAAPAPYPDYSAAALGGTKEVPLPVMTFPH